MTLEHDPGVRDAYRRFDRDHARLRRELLEELQRTPPAAMAVARQRPVGMRVRWWPVGLAASLLLAAAVWALLFRSPGAVYGIADVRARLTACGSVRVEGWKDVGGVRYPWHVYVEAGKSFWCTTLSGQDDEVYTGYSAGDSQRYVTVSDRDRTAVFGREDPLAFELMTRGFLQIGLPDQLLGANDRGFARTGAAQLRGHRVDVYERRRPGGRREVVWLNPSDGLPVRFAFFEPDADGRERQSAETDVTTNGPPPPGLPAPEPPVGYAATRRDRQPREALGGAGSSVNGERLQVLLALNLEGRAVLLCWIHSNDAEAAAPEAGLGGAVGSRQPLDVKSPDGKRTYVALHVRDDPWEAGRHARWSLLVPEDGGQVGRAEITLRRPDGEMHVGIAPLRVDRSDLARLVTETQKLTLPDGAAALDLDQLEHIAGSPVGNFR